MDAGCDEVGDLRERSDASAGSYGGAVESSGGAGEFELAIEGPVLQQSIDEACVEDVAGPGGVDYWDAEGWDVEQAGAVEGQHSFGP